MQAASEAFETWRDTTPADRQRALLKLADAMEKRADEFVTVESENTGKPLGLHEDRGDPAGDRPDPVLRRCRAGARGQVGRRVPGRPHVVRPARADRRRRPGDAVELPAHDGDLEDRAGARGRQHCLVHQADRHHAGLDAAARPRSAHESSRPACSTSSPATATPAGPWWRTRSRRWSSITGSVRAGMEVAKRRPPTTSSGCTSSSAARRRSSCSTTPTSRRRPRRSREPATSTPARTAPPPPACWPGRACTRTSSPRSPSRPRTPRPVCPTTRTCSTARSTTPTSWSNVSGFIDRLPDHAKLQAGGHRVGDKGYFYAPTVVSGLKQDDEADPGRDLRAGHHRAAVQRRGRGAALGQRRAVRPGVAACSPRTTAARCGWPAARLRLRVDQHPHPDRGRDAARRVQALRLRQGPVDVRARGLHPHQARDDRHHV